MKSPKCDRCGKDAHSQLKTGGQQVKLCASCIGEWYKRLDDTTRDMFHEFLKESV